MPSRAPGQRRSARPATDHAGHPWIMLADMHTLLYVCGGALGTTLQLADVSLSGSCMSCRMRVVDGSRIRSFATRVNRGIYGQLVWLWFPKIHDTRVSLIFPVFAVNLSGSVVPLTLCEEHPWKPCQSSWMRSSTMPPVVCALLACLAACFRSRRSIQLEILALRHQLAVYQRSVPKLRIQPMDRLLWAWLARMWSGWQTALAFVQPRTVITWQRTRFRDHWRR